MLTEIMEQVVERGTGKNARIDGFTVAGKTGTAQKMVNGQYSRSDYNASFVGFVPSRQPNSSSSSSSIRRTGGMRITAARWRPRSFSELREAALRLYGVPPSLNAAPPLIARWREKARRRRRGRVRPNCLRLLIPVGTSHPARSR